MEGACVSGRRGGAWVATAVWSWIGVRRWLVCVAVGGGGVTGLLLMVQRNSL
jgi:hypothetical protein